jgi:uncharacterized protein
MRSLLALLVLGVLLKAQTAASDPIDPEKAAIIRQMIQAEGVDTLKKQVLSMTKLIRSTVLRQNPNYPPSYMDELEKKFAEHVKETDIEDLAIPVYAKAFSVDELKQILAFRLSPVGRKVAFSQPEIVAGIVRASALYTQQVIPEINREVVADHPEWKKQLEEANSPPSLISKVDPQYRKARAPKAAPSCFPS